MKNITTTLTILLFLGMQNLNAQTGQFRVNTNNFIQIAYDNYKVLTFGKSTGNPNNGNWAIEYCQFCTNKGLNFWKPWPTTGAANFLLHIRDNGSIGMGNDGDNSYRLNITGNARANSWWTFSDSRFKTNIKPLSTALSTLNNLKVYQYDFKSMSKEVLQDEKSINDNKESVPYSFDNKSHFGFLAQDVEKVYSELVTKDDNGYLSVNYVEFVPLLVKALQEQSQKIEQLEKEIEKLKR